MRSITDTAIGWPGWQQVARVLSLQDHNTRVVIIGTTLLGVAAGLIGTFMLLRKRALMADALSHATLPGIAIAFMVMVILGGDGKSLPGLLAGALISGVLGVGCVLVIRHFTRLKEDAALGVVLSVFFGAGIALLGIIQKMEAGHAAGLESFIYGKTASMLTSDAMMIAAAAAIIALASALLFKEFTLICFDQGYARAQGWPVMLLDVLMMALVVGVTVIGLQAVGLILVIALLVIPPAAARFWTHRLLGMLLVAGFIGALSGLLGAGLSALLPRLPAGAVIVVVAGLAFLVSMIAGPAQGLSVRWIEHHRLSRKVARQHLLRAMFEYGERLSGTGLSAARAGAGFKGPAETEGHSVSFDHLVAQRSWSAGQLRRLLAAARREGLIHQDAGAGWSLTERGLAEARRVVRNHRLWELYLITHADIAASHVDRDADQLEHVLGSELVERLESLLGEGEPTRPVPYSPHVLQQAGPSPGV